MSLREYPDVDQGSDEWLALRCGMVTASIIGNLITSKTMKPADNETSRGLLKLLVAERITGHVEETWTSDDMYRGKMLEPIARDLYGEHYAPVDEIGFMTRKFGLVEIGASPDGLVGDEGGIEVKAPRAKNHLETILTGEVPARYMPQVQCCLMVSGRAWWDFVSYSPGLPLFVKRVEPDGEYQKALFDAVEAFERDAAKMIADYEAKSADLIPTETIDLDTLGVDLKL